MCCLVVSCFTALPPQGLCYDGTDLSIIFTFVTQYLTPYTRGGRVPVIQELNPIWGMPFVALSFDIVLFWYFFGPCRSFETMPQERQPVFQESQSSGIYQLLIRLIRLHVSIFSHHQQTQNWQLKTPPTRGLGVKELNTNYRIYSIKPNTATLFYFSVYCSRVLIIFLWGSNVQILNHCYNQGKYFSRLAITWLLLHLLCELNIIPLNVWGGVYQCFSPKMRRLSEGGV